MLHSRSTILGIDPGARRIGISVFKDGELSFYAVKSIKKAKKEDSIPTLRKILRDLLIVFRVEAVALEKLVFVQQSRTFVKKVYDEIRRFLKALNITLFEYDPQTVRSLVCRPHKPTKQHLARSLAQKHAQLARYFNVPRSWQKMYYAQLFDAVAVAQVCVIKLGERAPRLLALPKGDS